MATYIEKPLGGAEKTQLDKALNDVLIPEARSILNVAGGDKDIAAAIEIYNKERTMTARFPYPKTYASFGKNDESSSGVFSTTGTDGPFTVKEPSDLTMDAMFALLAARQNLARSHLHYPLAYFVGADDTTTLPKDDNLDLFSRVVMGDITSDKNEYVAIIEFSKTHPRRAFVTAWVPSKEQGVFKDENLTEADKTAAIEKREKIRTVIQGKWDSLRGDRKPPISNIEQLNNTVGGLPSEFIRGTGSEHVHSLFWPLVKLLTTSDDFYFYSDLHTELALKDWPEGKEEGKEKIEGFDGSTKWHQWTMAVLAHGSIPYWKHLKAPEPAPYTLLHMKKSDLDAFSKNIRIRSSS